MSRDGTDHAAMTAEPYTDVSAHMRDELRRVWLRVEYQIRLGWRKESGLVGEDIIGPEDMGRLFAAARGATTAGDSGAELVLEQWLAAHQATEARIRATIDAKIRSPLVDVIRTFGLTQRQWSALLFALMPEIDPNLVQAYRYLARDSSCRGLDGRLLAQLVYDTPQTRSLMARDLSAGSPLLRYRLLDVTSPGAPGDSLMFRRIRAAQRLVYILDGGPLELDPELAELAELRWGAISGAFPALTVDRATSAMRSNDVVLAVQGQRGLGKKTLLQLAVAHWNQKLLVVDSKRLSQLSLSTQQVTVRSLVRELALLDALPAFVDIDDATVVDADQDALPAFFEMFLDEWSGPVAITINRERMPRIHQRPLVHLTLEVPPLQVRAAMWQQVVPSLAPQDAEGLAGRFAIPGGIIVAAAQAAEASRMPDAPAPSALDLDRAVAAQLHQRISRLGKKLPTPFDLDDLIVDDDTRAALVEIAAAARERRKIRDQFKLRGAQGISVLLSGHPGVGKTMSGTVLAKRLGLDIYEIDLSQVVSKWLGETEKNLSDVFDAAEPGHVVLLFNEADSLFGKRTSDVKSSNDRYANLETNYLLQRLERFNGLTILTTNLTGAIDQAFKRRFTYDVYFTFPSPEMRAELWRRTLPERTRAATIDFEAIAEKYELTGGFIKVACERAAYVAGATNTEIDDDLLRATVERMYRERGKLSTVGPLE
jgi:SpoVK/Ycf46/Vps4 family AAA+-type ATPase